MFVGLTPFMEQQALWEQISNPNAIEYVGSAEVVLTAGNSWPSMGGPGSSGNYVPWRTNIPTLRCPSDPGQGLPALGRTNYAACLGDSIHYSNEGTATWNGMNSVWNDANSGRAQQTRAACRGIFVPREPTAFRDILDGLANTIMAGEIPTDLGDRDTRTILYRSGTGVRDNPSVCNAPTIIDPERPQFWLGTIVQATTAPPTDGQIERSSQARGYQWADGRPLDTGFLTVLPPNSELCAQGGEGSRMTAPAGSRHQGGCHVLMGDGAVKFVTDSIEAGDSTHPGVRRDTTLNTATPETSPGFKSPYGLWGSLGTRAAKEVIEEEL
jgi:prepilin-type processing-associated H-X9-DG protein